MQDIFSFIASEVLPGTFAAFFAVLPCVESGFVLWRCSVFVDVAESTPHHTPTFVEANSFTVELQVGVDVTYVVTCRTLATERSVSHVLNFSACSERLENFKKVITVESCVVTTATGALFSSETFVTIMSLERIGGNFAVLSTQITSVVVDNICARTSYAHCWCSRWSNSWISRG